MNEVKFQMVPVGMIQLSNWNYRQFENEDSIKELRISIHHQGLLSPITVRPIEWNDIADGDNVWSTPTLYEVVCGSRRFRACKQITTMKEIPCIVREMDDDEAFDVMITENIQREEVDPFDEAFAFSQLTKKHTVKEIAMRFGKSEKFVRNRMLLNNLLHGVAQWVRDGDMSLETAYIIARLPQDVQEDMKESNTIKKNMTGWEVKNLTTQGKQLERVLFDKDAEMEGVVKKCTACQYNSQCQGDLFGFESAPMCSNPGCWEKKQIAGIIAKALQEPADTRFVIYSYYHKEASALIDALRAAGIEPMISQFFSVCEEPCREDFDEEEDYMEDMKEYEEDLKGYQDDETFEPGILLFNYSGYAYDRGFAKVVTESPSVTPQGEEDETETRRTYLHSKIEKIEADRNRKIEGVISDIMKNDADSYVKDEGNLGMAEYEALHSILYSCTGYEFKNNNADTDWSQGGNYRLLVRNAIAYSLRVGTVRDIKHVNLIREMFPDLYTEKVEPLMEEFGKRIEKLNEELEALEEES